MQQRSFVTLAFLLVACSAGSTEVEDDSAAADSAISVDGVTSIDLTVSSGLPSMPCRGTITVDFEGKKLVSHDCEGNTGSRPLDAERLARVKTAVSKVSALPQQSCDSTTGGDLGTLLTVHQGPIVTKYISSHADGAGCHGQISADNHSLNDVEHVVYHILEDTLEGTLRMVDVPGGREPALVTASEKFTLDFEESPWLAESFVEGRMARITGALDEARTTLSPDKMLVCPAPGTRLHCGPPVMDSGCDPDARSWLAAKCEGVTFQD